MKRPKFVREYHDDNASSDADATRFVLSPEDEEHERWLDGERLSDEVWEKVKALWPSYDQKYPGIRPAQILWKLVMEKAASLEAGGTVRNIRS